MLSAVAANWRQVQGRVAAAAERGGRGAGDITVIAVSKTFPAEVVCIAYESGVRVFGENRVQEALQKIQALPADAEWHLIGHLQSNKARLAVGRFALIHSVDSVQLARELDRQAAKRNFRQAILVQVNVADEETKTGFAPAAALDGVSEIARLAHLDVRGFMTIGPLVSKPEDSRWVFRELRGLRDKVQARLPDVRLKELSMGMTGDFEAAIEEGATLIRVGRAIFGERQAR